MTRYDVSVPAGFADNVMLQIAELERSQASEVFSSRWMELGLVSAGAVFAVWNLIQFVLGVILPSLA
jgi:hypothetical protein